MLQMQNLRKVYNRGTVNENVVINGLSLNIDEGDFITVIGSNGAGKSTLLNAISGAIEVDEGSIVLNGKEISNLPEFKRSRFIGRVFQNPAMGTSPSMTILENLSMAFNKGKRFGLTFGVSKRNISHFREILSQLNLGLEDKLNVKVGLLSGGQRQALSLIMATMSDPEILLLDEHTAALDPATSERIIEITQDIVQSRKITTLMVTHNLHHAIDLGNRIIMMHRGSIILDIKGDKKKGLTKESLLKLFEKTHPDDLSDRLLLA
ncbi:ABC transporter ATP-binding protein [Fonticella tunisiensis]|uniref:Putative ABC transport system ATP-binding protein n=1 Tax=Fonticella tunisiensis TaxID=1096341 RepID=A0A4R7KQK3_9CLOT|nr:ATP-binding cassette domain-containing protein [Fonticella tunisiensis]TDT61345.1 putative ABC transport system ATP-binding protein [Fonticella tunisiensis]